MSTSEKQLKNFEVEGKFKAGIMWKKFIKSVESYSEDGAVEKVFSVIGSNHKLPRRMVHIEEVREKEGYNG